MLKIGRRRLFVASFTLALSLVVGVFAYNTFAAGANLFVFGPTTAPCARTGASAAAGYQGNTFGIELQGFLDSEQVAISFTFPDGRVFSPTPAQLIDANSLVPAGAINGLDGVIDMPPNFPFVFPASRGGDYYNDFVTTGRWPYGCYTFTARGLTSSRQASGSFVLIPGGGPRPNVGPTTLSVQDNTTGDPSGQQGTLVDIFGRGFLGQEVVSVWITAPDGTVIDYPQQITSDIGSFQSTFRFSGDYPVGYYTFTALGTLSGYRVFGTFNLTSRPVTQTGFAALRVVVPFGDNQRTVFEVQGKRFNPAERVDIWMTLPDGSVRGLPSQFANEYGEFFADLYLDERLPTGFYQFTAKGSESGRLVIAPLTLDPGSPNVTDTTPNLVAAPEVVDSNGGDVTLGPITNQPGIQTIDPKPEPSF
jgi:hypothetical protein